jgi:hypothetical protein
MVAQANRSRRTCCRSCVNAQQLQSMKKEGGGIARSRRLHMDEATWIPKR